MNSKTLKYLMVICLLTLNQTFAQQDQARAAAPADVVALTCEVLNPSDLENSDKLGNFSIRAYNSVFVYFSPAHNQVQLSMLLSGGRYSMAPIKPRVYLTTLKPTATRPTEIVLKNLDREESDHVKISPNLDEGKIILDGVELNIICGESEF